MVVRQAALHARPGVADTSAYAGRVRFIKSCSRRKPLLPMPSSYLPQAEAARGVALTLELRNHCQDFSHHVHDGRDAKAIWESLRLG